MKRVDSRAPRARSHGAAQRSKARGGMLLGLFLGLVAGMLIAFGIVWYLNKTPLPFLDRAGRAERPAEPPAGKAPEPLPGKPGDKVGEKPRFEFYKILPGTQEATPAPSLSPAAAPAAVPVPMQAVADGAAGEKFYLQVGAFQKPAEADNLKAKLSLMGLDVDIQEVANPDKGLLYRVRVGPYAKPDDMNRARNQLAQSGIQSTLVKITPKN